MRNQWLAYAIVAVIAALAGVAIAGPPNMVGRDDTIVVPATTSTTTVAPTTTEAAEPTDDDEVDGTEDDADDTAGDEQATADTTTTTSTTTTTTTVPDIDRADVVVVALNGAGTAGLATRTRDELIDLGWTSARASDGSTLVDETVVYYFPGNENAAGVVAFDIGIDPFLVQPVEDAPGFGTLPGDQVAVYIGRDRG